MPNISTGINLDSNFLNLKAIEIKEVRPEVEKLLVDGEKIMCAFKTIRDQVIFTNNRIFVVNVKGVTGKKSAYFSVQLINLLKPKVVILEGKTVFNNIVEQCYQKKVWSVNDFGYLYDDINNTHIIVYKRSGFSNENRVHFTNKLKEILE